MYYVLGVSILTLSKIFLVDFGPFRQCEIFCLFSFSFEFMIEFFFFKLYILLLSELFHVLFQNYVTCFIKTSSRAFFYLYDCRRGIHTSHLLLTTITL